MTFDKLFIEGTMVVNSKFRIYIYYEDDDDATDYDDTLPSNTLIYIIIEPETAMDDGTRHDDENDNQGPAE